MQRFVFALIVTFGIVSSESFFDFEANQFFKGAKKFLWCQFCQEIERQNETGAERCLELLRELNEVFEKNSYYGFPTGLRPIEIPDKKIGQILNNKKKVLRSLAIEKIKRSAVESRSAESAQGTQGAQRAQSAERIQRTESAESTQEAKRAQSAERNQRTESAESAQEAQSAQGAQSAQSSEKLQNFCFSLKC